MKLFNNKIPALLAAFTLVSGSLVVVQQSFADTGGTIGLPSAPQVSIANRSITESEVLAAQNAWGEALVDISTTYETQGLEEAKTLAEKVIDEAYGYQFGPVLFKPTLTVAPQTFRTTRAGALSYFVGHDPAFPMDGGFALKGWREVEVQNAAIVIAGNTATTMGNVIFTNKTGETVTVDKTWEFLKDDSGKLRIIVHHSSLPYKPDADHSGFETGGAQYNNE